MERLLRSLALSSHEFKEMPSFVAALSIRDFKSSGSLKVIRAFRSAGFSLTVELSSI
jgi:hypothetical protein